MDSEIEQILENYEDEKDNFIYNVVNESNLDNNRIYNKWVDFFETSHGEIFESLEYENPKKRAFSTSLYYDYVVNKLICRIESLYDIEVINKYMDYNNKNISFNLSDAYKIGKPEDLNIDVMFDSLDKNSIDSLDAESVRRIQKNIIPKDMRSSLGEFHTPLSLCKLTMSQMSSEKVSEESFFDPGSGSGTFVSACISKKIETIDDISLTDITDSVYGIDLNPVSVKSTKLSYLLSVSDLLDSEVKDIEIPVFLKDALELTRADELKYQNQSVNLNFDNLIGNPPYITWEDLPKNLKDAWENRYVNELNLLPKEGTDKILGHANDDISVPYVWVCIHKYLKQGGSSTFIMKRDLMKSSSGELFRKQRVGEDKLSISWIIDFNKLRPFGSNVQVDVAIYSMNKSTEQNYPIKCLSASRKNTKADFNTESKIYETIEFNHTKLIPIYNDDPSSILVNEKIGRKLIGNCPYDIRHGVKGDKKSVFKLDDNIVQEIENDRVYPFVTSRHIVKFGLFGTPDRYLLPIDKTNQENADKIKKKYPKTYQYLQDNIQQLNSRSSSWLDDGEFYNMFGVGDYTWEDYKVCWCRLGFKPHFAVFSTYDDDLLGEKMVIPGDHYMYIPTDNRKEAMYITGLLNSPQYQEAIEAIASRGKSSISKGVIDKLRIPEYEDKNIQNKIAEIALNCTGVVSKESQNVSKRKYNSKEIDELEQNIDELEQTVSNYIDKMD